jgi:hypothetical protein
MAKLTEKDLKALMPEAFDMGYCHARCGMNKDDVLAMSSIMGMLGKALEIYPVFYATTLVACYKAGHYQYRVDQQSEES